MTQSSTAPRTVEQITNDYARNAQAAGHVHYQIEIAKKEVARLETVRNDIMQKMEQLNEEAAAMPKAEPTKEDANEQSKP